MLTGKKKFFKIENKLYYLQYFSYNKHYAYISDFERKNWAYVSEFRDAHIRHHDKIFSVIFKSHKTQLIMLLLLQI